MNIIFLAAGKGSRLSKLNLKNKCLINIKKKNSYRETFEKYFR